MIALLFNAQAAIDPATGNAFGSLLGALLAQGPFGIIAAVALYWAYRKDKQATKLQETVMVKQELNLQATQQLLTNVDRVVTRLEDALSRRVRRKTE